MIIYGCGGCGSGGGISLPVNNSSIHVVVMGTGYFAADGKLYPYQLLRIEIEGKEPAYAQWFPRPDGKDAPVVMLTDPYGGITWNGDQSPMSEADVSTPEKIFHSIHIYLFNGFAALNVFGRFYTGGDIQGFTDYITIYIPATITDETKLLQYQTFFTPFIERIAATTHGDYSHWTRAYLLSKLQTADETGTPFSLPISVTLYLSYLMNRIALPDQTLINGYDPDALNYFVFYLKRFKDAGTDMEWAAPRLLDLADARRIKTMQSHPQHFASSPYGCPLRQPNQEPV